ncbi:MAG: ABC transporter ATP-binding protein [Candidatus Methanomethylophilaceae archaeon]|nr:ABC transporter ATP-binding protein [Candidatus Methanomethylophilaceae archaeon]
MILKYLRKVDWLLIVAAAVFIFVQVYFDLKIPDYMFSITTILTTGGTSSEIMSEGWLMLGCALGSLLAAIITGGICAYIAASFAKTIREKQFDKVEQFSLNEINKFSTYSLITRSTNDIVQVQMAIAMGLQIIIKAPITAVWALHKILDKNLEWTLITAIAVVILVAVIAVIMYLVIPKFRMLQWLTDDVNRVSKENLDGMRVVRAYNAEGYQESKFETANANLTDTGLYTVRVLSVLSPVMTIVMNGLSLAIYWVGSYIIMESMNPMVRIEEFSNMIVFSSYAMQVIMSFMMMIMIFMIIPRASVAAKRIEEVINTEPSILDGDVTESNPEMKGTVEFRNVSFKYSDNSGEVLSNLNFEVKKGEVVAFIGSTGCGKSTLVNLIPRLYDVNEGQVLVDGVDVRDYRQDVLHEKIGYVPQKSILFSGTVESNVNYGGTSHSKTLDDVKRAVSIAQGKDFIEKMEGQYDAHVSEGGTNLSGGQKQRISIARAICKNPEIYIFDDSFSALDYKTDRVLRKALREETEGITTLIVAQRIGTVLDADKIIVLEDGKIVGMGKHSELLKTCPVYKDIALSQLSEEELVQ